SALRARGEDTHTSGLPCWLSLGGERSCKKGHCDDKAKDARPWSPHVRSRCPDSGQNLDVALKARIDLEVSAKLAAESRHFDGLPRAQAGDIDARRGADE